MKRKISSHNCLHRRRRLSLRTHHHAQILHVLNVIIDYRSQSSWIVCTHFARTCLNALNVTNSGDASPTPPKSIMCPTCEQETTFVYISFCLHMTIMPCKINWTSKWCHLIAQIVKRKRNRWINALIMLNFYAIIVCKLINSWDATRVILKSVLRIQKIHTRLMSSVLEFSNKKRRTRL